jgi:VanZ family protein
MKLSTQLYIGWVVFIALLTLVPGKALPQIDWNFLSFDKFIHFTIFSVMTFLGGASFKNSLGLTKVIMPIIISLLIAILYGTTLEYLQSFIPDREFDYADLAANIGGSLVGILLFFSFSTRIFK